MLLGYITESACDTEWAGWVSFKANLVFPAEGSWGTVLLCTDYASAMVEEAGELMVPHIDASGPCAIE